MYEGWNHDLTLKFYKNLNTLKGLNAIILIIDTREKINRCFNLK